MIEKWKVLSRPSSRLSDGGGDVSPKFKINIQLKKGDTLKVSRNSAWQDVNVVDVVDDLVTISYEDNVEEVLSSESSRFYPMHRLLTDTEKLERFYATQNEYGKIGQVEIPLAKPRAYKNHDCNQRCLVKFVPCLFEGENPYLVPMMLGWSRDIICLRSESQKNPRTWKIMYIAPCGKRLKSIEEVALYLAQCHNSIPIDFFCFDPWVKVLDEFIATGNNINVPDITQGKELNPIPAVNNIDTSVPVIDYITENDPQGNVCMPTTDPAFLLSCDCEDTCSDKRKCACAQLTIKATAQDAQEKFVLDDAGYDHRRLKNIYFTGVFECNSRCKCSEACHNKVTQRPIQAKLQLFKTANRGWGLRTLHDLPEGAFICKYVGKLYNSTDANEEGGKHGDDYFCELDLIEIVERRKEGYESDVSDIEADDSDNDDESENKPNGFKVEKDETEFKENGTEYVNDVKLKKQLEEVSSTEVPPGGGGRRGAACPREPLSLLPITANLNQYSSECVQCPTVCTSDVSMADVIDRYRKHSKTCHMSAPYTIKCTQCPVICTSSTSMPDLITSFQQHWKMCHANHSAFRGPVDETEEASLSSEASSEVSSVVSSEDTKPEDLNGHGHDGEAVTNGTSVEPNNKMLIMNPFYEGSDTASLNNEDKETEEPGQGTEEPPVKRFKSIRKLYPKEEREILIIDAMKSGNIGRYMNHSCDPNVWVQNVFQETHDLRFPTVSFFTCRYVRAGEELCWKYDYEIDSVPGKQIMCHCGADICKKRLL